MRTLKLICLTVIGLVKQTWLLPQSVAAARQKRRHRIARDELEMERLDRIRNPSKYIGR